MKMYTIKLDGMTWIGRESTCARAVRSAAKAFNIPLETCGLKITFRWK